MTTLVPAVADGPHPDARSALRAATATLHAQIDSQLPLAGADPSLADYRAHLELLRDWAATLRDLPVDPALLDAEERSLQADIDECRRLQGEAPSRPRAAGPAPITPSAPSAMDGAAPSGRPIAAAAGWGVAYVLEGSRLGGQVLYRRLAGRLAPHSLSYLRGTGTATGPRWKAFVAALDRQLATPADIEAACGAAVLAFERLLHCHRARRRVA